MTLTCLAFALLKTAQIYWSPLDCPDDFVANTGLTRNLIGYPSKTLVAVKREKSDTGHAFLVINLPVGVQWLLGTTYETRVEVQVDYAQYSAVADSEAILPSEVPFEAVDDTDKFLSKNYFEILVVGRLFPTIFVGLPPQPYTGFQNLFQLPVCSLVTLHITC